MRNRKIFSKDLHAVSKKKKKIEPIAECKKIISEVLIYPLPLNFKNSTRPTTVISLKSFAV